MSEKNLATLFQNRVYRFGSRPGFHFQQEGRQVELSWQEAGNSVKEIGRALLHLKVESKERIALLTDGGSDAAFLDLAALSIGAVPTPIYPTLPVEQIIQSLVDTNSRIVFTKDPAQAERLENIRNRFPSVRQIIPLERSSLDTFRAAATKIPASQFFERLAQVESEAEASLTEPHSHSGVIARVKEMTRQLPLSESKSSLSLLPFGHEWGRLLGLYSLVYAGSRVAFTHSLEEPILDARTGSPVTVLVLPKTLERLHHNCYEVLFDQPRPSRFFIRKALSTKANGSLGPFSGFVLPRIRQQFGGEMKNIVSIGGFISPKILSFFQRIGVNVMELPPRAHSSDVDRVEADLRADPLVEEACVIAGTGSSYSSLIVPNFRYLERQAQSEKIPTKDRASLASHPSVRNWYSKMMESFNASRPESLRIRNFEILPEPFSAERKEVLPFHVLQRDAIRQNYGSAIGRMTGK